MKHAKVTFFLVAALVWQFLSSIDVHAAAGGDVSPELKPVQVLVNPSIALRLQLEYDISKDATAMDEKLTVVFSGTLPLATLREHFLNGEYITKSSTYVSEAWYAYDADAKAAKSGKLDKVFAAHKRVTNFMLVAKKLVSFPHFFTCHEGTTSSKWAVNCDQTEDLPDGTGGWGGAVLVSSTRKLGCRHENVGAPSTVCEMEMKSSPRNKTSKAPARLTAYQLFIEDAVYLARIGLMVERQMKSFDETRAVFVGSDHCKAIAKIKARFPDFVSKDKAIQVVPVAAAVGTTAVEVQTREGIDHEVPVVGQFSTLSPERQEQLERETIAAFCK